MNYLKITPDPQYAFEALAKDTRELILTWMRENAATVGLKPSNDNRFVYVTGELMRDQEDLKLISSTKATNFMRMDWETYQEVSNPKKIRFDPSLVGIMKNDVFWQKVKETFGEAVWNDDWKCAINQIANLNLSIPYFSYTPDLTIKYGNKWIAVIEHKVCASTERNTLSPMITNGRNQLMLQMMCSNCNYGLLAIKDPCGCYDISLFTSEGPEMRNFTKRYLESPLGKIVAIDNKDKAINEWLKERNKTPPPPSALPRKAGRPTNQERAQRTPAGEGLVKRAPKSARLRKKEIK